MITACKEKRLFLRVRKPSGEMFFFLFKRDCLDDLWDALVDLIKRQDTSFNRSDANALLSTVMHSLAC